jgi:DNA-binding protein H-NS
VPAVCDTGWPAGWIDRFILSRLESEQLTPSADADKTTLIRRLSIDVIGLPPTPAEVDAFLADNRPEAYEALVDRLLASPRFGERIASYWFDLVRYASTVGYHGDQDHQIAPYRDWVIAAFNRNLPFDQFTREQLAGDLLPNPTIEQRIATGYNRMLQTSHEGGVQPKEYLAIYAADRVRNFSAVWLGGTMGCAQCHDHKFDPYTTKDFYSMEAFFADIDEARHLTQGTNSLPTARPPELEILNDDEQATLVGLEGGLKELQAKLANAGANQLAPNGATDKVNEQAAAQARKQAAAINKQIARYKKQIAAVHAASTKSMVTVAIAPRESAFSYPSSSTGTPTTSAAKTKSPPTSANTPGKTWAGTRSRFSNTPGK